MARTSRKEELEPVGTQIVSRTPAAAAATEAEMRSEMELVVESFGGGLPWHPEIYKTEIKRQSRTVIEAMLRTGALLIVAKANVEHGGWIPYLKDIELDPSTASRMMAAARQFMKLTDEDRKRMVESVKTINKVYQLITLPDEKFKALASEGEVGNIVLDELDKKSRKELQDEIEALKADLQAKDERAMKRERDIEKKSAELAKLRRQLKEAPVDERIERLRNAVTACQMGILAKIEAFEENAKAEPVDSLKTHLLALVQDEDPEIAQADHRGFMAGVIDDLIHALRLLRDHPDLDLQQVKARKH